jgi:hypothetical protein
MGARALGEWQGDGPRVGVLPRVEVLRYMSVPLRRLFDGFSLGITFRAIAHLSSCVLAGSERGGVHRE